MICLGESKRVAAGPIADPMELAEAWPDGGTGWLWGPGVAAASLGGVLMSVPMSLEERLETIRSGPVPPNEESAKIQVIIPILKNLGWDSTDGSEFLLEHPVGGTKGGRVDIALRAKPGGRQRLVALIEAKAPRADLRQHLTQVLGYAFFEGVDVCVLTTGLEWWLFLPRESGDPIQRRFATLDLESDSVERLVEDLNAFLGKEALIKGQAQKKAQSVLKARLDADHLEAEIPKIWERMLGEPDEELVELVAARVYKKLDLRPEKGQVIAALRGEPVPLVDTKEAPPPSKPVTNKTRARSKQPTAILLWGTHHPISSHKQVLHVVTNLLYERHAPNFDQLLELKGRRFPFVARSRDAFGDSAHLTVNQVKSSNYFVVDHGNAETMRKRAELFLECFGYEKSDLEVLFD